MYHGLTTLRGVQTLGEEYCDIQQVKEEASAKITRTRFLISCESQDLLVRFAHAERPWDALRR